VFVSEQAPKGTSIDRSCGVRKCVTDQVLVVRSSLALPPKIQLMSPSRAPLNKETHQ